MVSLQPKKKKKKSPGHESQLTFLSIRKQFHLGKLPHSIDSDNKWHCPANICFRLPHWYCRPVLRSEFVFTSCWATEELEITGTVRFYYWNTGKLPHRAGKFCIFEILEPGLWEHIKPCGRGLLKKGEGKKLFLVHYVLGLKSPLHLHITDRKSVV